MTAQAIMANEATYSPSHLGDAFIKRYGAYSLAMEQKHYALMDRYVQGYNGGRFKNLHTPNGLVVRVLDSDETFVLSNAENYFEAEVSAEAASLAVFVMAVNKLIWAYHSLNDQHAMEFLIDEFEKLTDYIRSDIPYSREINRFLD